MTTSRLFRALAVAACVFSFGAVPVAGAAGQPPSCLHNPDGFVWISGAPVQLV
jgi:hypothetical protein